MILNCHKIFTWNVNSISSRLPHVLDFLDNENPDILALQELKCIDDSFPTKIFEAKGYNVYTHGQKQYNGVAILAKKTGDHHYVTNSVFKTPENLTLGSRVISLTFGDLEIINLYVPNGREVGCEFYHQKILWLNELCEYLAIHKKMAKKTIILGDFNIVPTLADSFRQRGDYTPAELEQKVFHTKLEQQTLKNILELGFVDSFRYIYPSEIQFSWWDYRMGSFQRDLGLRIDLIFASENMSKDILEVKMLKQYRAMDKPSDHIPVGLYLKET